jgi:protein-S-isoprenylcysteine O-methyltransferase Ste14
MGLAGGGSRQLSAGPLGGARRMPKTAIALNLMFLLLAIGWRSFVQYRRTDDIGLRKPSGSASALDRIAGAVLAIGVIGLLVTPVCALVGVISPLEPLDRPAIHVLGVLVAIFGIALTVLAEFEMGDSWRVGVDPSETTELVMHGLFAYIRNPIYSGMLLFAIGLFSLVPTFLSIVAGIVFVLGIQLQVRGVEEPYLSRKHGQTYSRYARTAGRFLPWVGRLR